MNRASDNAQDGISLIQTVEGAMDQQHAILQRARELAVQAANDTNFSKESILQQAATSMLAQANQQNQGVLSLLQ